jgi:hypothetical protein
VIVSGLAGKAADDVCTEPETEREPMMRSMLVS